MNGPPPGGTERSERSLLQGEPPHQRQKYIWGVLSDLLNYGRTLRGGLQAELEKPVHGGRATEIPNGLPGQGRPAELPGGGMTRPSSKEDGNAGALTAPACPRHRGHYGGGKPPPPTVHPMRHSGHPAGTERQAPCHSSVRQGSGAKETAASGGGNEGELGEGL